MSDYTILLSAPYMLPFKERFIPILDHYGCEVILPEVNERLNEVEILKFAGKFDGTICGDDRYSRAVIQACSPRLKVISKWGTGIDSIDSQAASEHGVIVNRTINAFTTPVSDSVIGYILAFARQLPWLDAQVKAGDWKKLPGRALNECVLGVVGVGYIGKEVLRKAHAFGMTLLANDIIPVPEEIISNYSVEVVSLQDLLRRADFVSVNCDLNPTSVHLINSKTIQHMKDAAVIINTARGPIIEETALIDALINRRIAGAALDVFEDEPLPANSPLRNMNNVLLAPHNSNSSPAAWERVHWQTLQNLIVGLGISHQDFDEIQKKNFRTG